MGEEQEDSGFDIDAGVADIAESMGFGTSEESEDDFNEEEGSENGLQEQKQETTEEVEEKTENTEVSVKAPPVSWSKEQHEIWAKLPPEAQEYIELREKQIADGMNGYKEIKGFADEMQRTLEPFRDEIRSHGITEAQAIQNLMGTHRVLTQGPLEARQEAFVKLGQSIGLIPNEGQPQIDPHTQELQQRITRMEQQENLRQQQLNQQAQTKIMSDLEAFAADPEHAYFDEVAEDMLPLLKPGMSMADVKSVYEKAVWANPVTRAKEQAKLIEDRTKSIAEKQRIEAEKAKKAKGSNVKPANTNRTTSEPTGTWDDTMAETLEKIKKSQ